MEGSGVVKRETHTPPRTVRVPDDLWQAAKATAEKQGRTVSEVIVAALRRFVARSGSK